MEPHKHKPPILARWLMKKLAFNSERSAILGDFEEEFCEKVAERGFIYAHLWYWLLLFVSVPSFFSHSLYWSVTMFKNYLVVAWRNVKRHKGFSFINVIGLAVGMACSLLIAVYVFHELSFDKHHEKADRIFRVGAQFGPTNMDRGAFSVPPLAKTLLSEYPEIEQAVRLSLWPNKYLVQTADKKFMERGVIYADASIFQVFTIPFLKGDPDTALTDPNTVVISQEIAEKYFGSDDPIGKILRFVDRMRDFKITGVIQNCPATSHFQYDMIASLISNQGSFDTGWGGHTYFTYILLKEDHPASSLTAKLPDFARRYWGAYHLANTGQSFEEFMRDKNNYYGYFLEPLKEIHLGKVGDSLSLKGQKVYIHIFSIIAVFILLIAIINFMNLSTARFAHRSKEVGVRKVLGSSRKQLIRQFLGESILLSLMASGIALVIIQTCLPAFRQLSARQLHLNVLASIHTLPLLFFLVVLIGLLAGSYPAFFLSSFSPLMAVQRKRTKTSHGRVLLRRSLVIFQFIITFGIMFGTLVISSQLRYWLKQDLGFKKEQVMVIHRADALGRQKESFKQELLWYPDILLISDTNSLPGRHFDANGHRLEGRPLNEEYMLYTMYADQNFTELLDLKLVEGRYFSSKNPTDLTSAVVINETAVREMGLVDPVGKRFLKEFGNAQEGEFVTIIGVLKDFHFQSLHQEILPMLIRPLSPREWSFTSIRIRPVDLTQTVGLIEKTWQKFSGEQPFEFSFLDTDFNSLYKKEQKTGGIFVVFAGLAIFIACLGLFGLVSFTVEERTKEIGIRKVLGASFSKILYLLSKEVVGLILVASLIAAPIAFYAMLNWLQNFAFRIAITPWLFILTGITALGIALLSIGYRTIRAAGANPADAIKYE